MILFCLRLVRLLINFTPAGVILPLTTLTSCPILKRPLSMIYARSMTRFLTLLIMKGSIFQSFFCSHDSTSSNRALANTFRFRRLVIFLCADRLPRDFMRRCRFTLSKVYDLTKTYDPFSFWPDLFDCDIFELWRWFGFWCSDNGFGLK